MSPLETLIKSWLVDPPTQPARMPYLHLQLWKAVSEEVIEKFRINILISPLDDPKVRWATMFLKKLSGESKAICPHIEANARFLLGLPFTGSDATDHKRAAANDR